MLNPKLRAGKAGISTIAKGVTFNNNAQVLTQHAQIVNSSLVQLKAILQTVGISSLDGIGRLNISGNVIPQTGLLRPGTPNIAARSNDTQIACTVFNKINNRFEKTVVQASVLPTEPLPISRGTPMRDIVSQQTRSQQIVSDAYWIGELIEIAANTNVIIQWPNNHLFIITSNLIIHENVTFSYERLSGSVQPVPGKPGDPGEGHQGTAGIKGNPGNYGSNAPSIEIWANSFTGDGQLVIDLSGEDGGPGGTGGNGGDGGKGAKGVDSVSRYFKGHAIDCTSGPTSGSQGSKGGKAGDGGDGGNGGNGGSVALYAPQEVLDAMSAGYLINLNPGAGGQAGLPGLPGNGGPGGDRGAVTGFCANRNWPDRVQGPTGPAGDAAGAGLPGANGITSSGNMVYQNPISADDFANELLHPAIISFADSLNTVPPFNNQAFVGDTIYIIGANFTSGDGVSIDGIALTPNYINYLNDSLLSIVVPSVFGGVRDVQVKQTDGTLSNLASLFIKPRITVPVPAVRIRPGNILELKGTGFMPDTRIMINDDQYITDMQFIDQETISFTVVRPGSITRNSAGELTNVKVSNAPDQYSNSIPLVLDTFKMHCFGDSIMWGQGLIDTHKFYYKAMDAISNANAGIGVYAENHAHSGAIIGKGYNNVNLPQDGEIPSSFPTIFKQHEGCKILPDAPFIDMILMDGGVNDLEIFTYLTPHIIYQQDAYDEIIQKAAQYCYFDMKDLLLDITASYPQAKVIVTGYYSPVTENSFLNPAIRTFLTALGLNPFITPSLASAFTMAEIASIVSQTALATTQMNTNLQAAINHVNATLPVARVFFADPMFQDDNAVFGTNPWLFAIDNILTLEDEVIDARNTVCSLVPNSTGNDFAFCRHASCGHPNVAGANAYFNAILPFL